jgi:hypothetical protein
VLDENVLLTCYPMTAAFRESLVLLPHSTDCSPSAIFNPFLISIELDVACTCTMTLNARKAA